jgi:hypothetical protein
MRDDHALLVHNEDVGDAGDLDELVDDRLEGRIVPVDDQVDIRVGNAARNRPTVVQESPVSCRSTVLTYRAEVNVTMSPMMVNTPNRVF